MAKPYAVYIAGAWQSLREKIRPSTVNSFPIQSFKFIHLVSSGTTLIVLVLMVGEADRQDFFLPKTFGFDFLLLNYMLLSA